MILRRRVARVVLLDPGERVLLIRAGDPFDTAGGQWWELPGGGLEPGEAPERAALRELHEETGLGADSISGPVWLQHVSFRFAGMHFDQHETVHVARGGGGEYRPQGLEAIEAAAMRGAEWWEPDRLVEADRIIPPWLAAQLPEVLAGGLPAEPIDLGHVD